MQNERKEKKTDENQKNKLNKKPRKMNVVAHVMVTAALYTQTHFIVFQCCRRSNISVFFPLLFLPSLTHEYVELSTEYFLFFLVKITNAKKKTTIYLSTLIW